jgi:hypothetical protein
LTSYLRRFIAVAAIVVGVPAIAALATGHPLQALAWVAFSGIFALLLYLQHDWDAEHEVDRVAGVRPAYTPGMSWPERWRARREHRRRRLAVRSRYRR